MQEKEKLLCIRQLKKEYDGLPIFSNFNLEVEKHEIVAIVGPSGCGKSTLLNLIAGISTVEKRSGYEGEIENQAKKTGYVFQEDRILPWLTVYENIRIVRKKEDEKRIRELIAQVKLEGFEDYYPGQLSGGMRQRCGIARAFYYGSELLLMDEPFKSLDYHLRMDMLKNLKQLWNAQKPSVIFVTHDIEEAIMIADRIVVLKNRPATVVGELRIPKTEELRDISAEKFSKMRTQIIEMIA